MIKKNSFEIIFILGISIFGACLITFLFKLSLFSGLGAGLILLGGFSLFYFSIVFFSSISERKAVAKPLPKKKVLLAPSTENNRTASLRVPKMAISKPTPIEQIKPQVEKKSAEKKSTMELFKENPIAELERARDQIVSLLDKTRNSFQKIEKIFGERMHKNTKTDIQNFLYLKQLNESLEKRLAQVIDVLDMVEKDNTLSLTKSFELAYGPLTLPKDSLSALKSEQDIPPIPRADWEKTVLTTLRKLSRKNTFHYALNYAIYN